MKAVGYVECLPIENERALFDFEAPKPVAGPRDLLVKIEAVSVNPVDTKERRRRAGTPQAPVILGWDAAGTVETVGEAVTLFHPGDEVYYAGSITRSGSNAEYGLVDERIVGHKPTSLSFAEAAALPLTTITAWESLFDRLHVPLGKAPTSDAILIIGAAGGVGSIAVQLARRLTALTVIGTASRGESQEWVHQAGAHVVVDHSEPLPDQLARSGRPTVRYVLSLTHTDQHWAEIVAMLAPEGDVCLTDDPAVLEAMQLKEKAGALHLEFMFARPMYVTPDMIEQHELLDEVSALVDDGLIRTTVGQHLGPINAANLRSAHAAIERGRAIGKIVLAGF
jgi:zinc-binding alcohol dehydrogenase family protein